MKYIEAQILLRMAYVLRHHALIVSGGYKLKKKSHGTITNNGPQFTEEELLADANDTMLRQVEILSETIDHFGKSKA